MKIIIALEASSSYAMCGEAHSPLTTCFASPLQAPLPKLLTRTEAVQPNAHPLRSHPPATKATPNIEPQNARKYEADNQQQPAALRTRRLSRVSANAFSSPVPLPRDRRSPEIRSTGRTADALAGSISVKESQGEGRWTWIWGLRSWWMGMGRECVRDWVLEW